MIINVPPTIINGSTNCDLIKVSLPSISGPKSNAAPISYSPNFFYALSLTTTFFLFGYILFGHIFLGYNLLGPRFF